jgi:hypothetical protein
MHGVWQLPCWWSSAKVYDFCVSAAGLSYLASERFCCFNCYLHFSTVFFHTPWKPLDFPGMQVHFELSHSTIILFLLLRLKPFHLLKELLEIRWPLLPLRGLELIWILVQHTRGFGWSSWCSSGFDTRECNRAWRSVRVTLKTWAIQKTYIADSKRGFVRWTIEGVACS